MPEKTKKHDFVEIEYIAKTDDGVFDTNIKDEAKKLNPQADPKPLIVCIGEKMVVDGLDKALEGKEIGKKETIKLQPEEAYGKRNPQLIKLIPKKVFIEHKMDPIAGMTVALDNSLAKIISVSGGRVLTDFNNPVAGKEVEYEFTIKRAISDIKEKVSALQLGFFRQEFEFDIDEQKKKIIFKETQLVPILNMFRDKFKDILGYDVEIFAKTEKKPEKDSSANEKSDKSEK